MVRHVPTVLMNHKIKIRPFIAGQFELPVIRVVLPAGPSIKVIGPIVRVVRPARFISHQFSFALGV